MTLTRGMIRWNPARYFGRIQLGVLSLLVDDNADEALVCC